MKLYVHPMSANAQRAADLVDVLDLDCEKVVVDSPLESSGVRSSWR